MKQDVETERSCRQAIYGRFASGSHRESRRLQRARDFFNILLIRLAVWWLHRQLGLPGLCRLAVRQVWV